MLSVNEIKLLEEVFRTVSNVEVQIQSIFKNGIQKTGVIFNTGSNIQPCVYVEDYQYMDFADLAKQMMVDIANLKHVPDEDIIDFISDWEWSKYRLRLCVSPKTNDNIIKRDCLDLQEYVRVFICSDENGTQTAKVNHELLKKWGVTEDEVFSEAREIWEENANIGGMLQIMMEKPIPLSSFKKEKASEPMLVVNGYYDTSGAGILACKDAISDIAKELEQDLYILPSSIHEVIIIPTPVATEEGLEEMSNMVMEVNQKEVRPEERLSNHAYAYSRATGKIFW